jgi:hypothetical protein
MPRLKTRLCKKPMTSFRRLEAPLRLSRNSRNWDLTLFLLTFLGAVALRLVAVCPISVQRLGKFLRILLALEKRCRTFVLQETLKAQLDSPIETLTMWKA